MNQSTRNAIDLLQQMIRIPSLSKAEDKVADLIEKYLSDHGLKTERLKNNIWVRSTPWVEGNQVCLLNSHIDTVKPAKSYTYDPFGGVIEEDRLIGLGSNDAGASVVSLIETFLHFKDKKLPYNLVLLISAEEEISGSNGVELVLPKIGTIDFGIVGEPTNKQICIAEKGLMVLDGKAIGISGHAARDVGENAIYGALRDIEKIKEYKFEKESELLGSTKATITQIKAGSQHNVIPDLCEYVVDVRTNELYSNIEVADLLNTIVEGSLTPRSTRLNSSKISKSHPLVAATCELGIEMIGSPTLSDQALMSFPTIKMGPGDSLRSHTADEYIYLSEIEEGINSYIQLLEVIRIEN